MSDVLWSCDELVRYSKWEDPEVRYWAIDRLIRHFPGECADAIAGFVLDDHDATPTMVARFLGEHGAPRHHNILLRGFRLLRGSTPGHCLRALAQLQQPGVVELAAAAFQRGDLTEPALAIVLEALADLGTPAARELLNESLRKKGELLAEPAALGAVLRVTEVADLPDLLARFLQAVQSRGTHRAGEGFRVLLDALQVDDASWCFRTGPSGRIELRKTLKAVESGYDCDIQAAMGDATLRQLAQRVRAGDLAEIVRSIAEWTRAATARLPKDPEDDLPARIAAAVGAFAAQPILGDLNRLGHQFQQWVVGFQLSTAIAVARYRNYALALTRARGDLDALLRLAEVETAFVLPALPPAIAEVCKHEAAAGRRAEEWCLRMLEAQGPFFPKVVALETLGELRAVHFIPEVMEYLSEENSYVYGAAERALGRMGEAIIAPASSRIESGLVDPDAGHSLLVLLSDLGTRGAYEVVMAHLDWFMEELGAGTTAEWVSLFGTEELIDPLRHWLDEDPALVGQALLLLAAMHNVRIPEESEILRAIEDERARQEREPEEEGTPEGPESEGGSYVM